MNSGTSGRSMKPWRAVTTHTPCPSDSASMRCRASTRGVSQASTLQHDHLLVQHLVVLEVVQQRMRHARRRRR